MKTLAVIPARYASTRLPGKPLAKIADRPMIQWVYEAVVNSGLMDAVYVATDDSRIEEAVKSFGGRVMRTAKDHPSGTSRCCEVLEKLSDEFFDAVINVQGDEPFLSVNQLQQVKSLLESSSSDVATLAHEENNTALYQNPNVVKLVRTHDEQALYFSRSPIPHQKKGSAFLRHIGVYGYTSHFLKAFHTIPFSPLAELEQLEQLQWLQAGYSIKVGITHELAFGVDTEEDLQKANEIAAQKQ